MAGGASLAGGVHVEPVAGNVDAGTELEHKLPPRIKGSEGEEETHSSTPITQHVQHGAEPST